MAVVYANHTEQFSGTLENFIDGATPVGTAAGDLLIAVLSTRRNGAEVHSAPDASWTQIESTASAGGIIATSVWWKIAGASEPASYHFTWAGSSSRRNIAIIRYTGADTTSPINNASVASSGVAQVSNITASGVLTSVDNCLVVRIYSTEDNTDATTAATQRWSYTGGQITHAGSDFLQATAGATGDSSCSLTSSEWATAYTVAIAPAVDGGDTVYSGASDLIASGGISASPIATYRSFTTTASSANVVADGTKITSGVVHSGVASLASDSGVVTLPRVLARSQSAVTATATIDPASSSIVRSQSAVTATATIDPAPSAIVRSQSAVTTTATIDPASSAIVRAGADLTADAVTSAESAKTSRSTAVFIPESSLAAVPELLAETSSSINGIGSLAANGSVISIDVNSELVGLGGIVAIPGSIARTNSQLSTDSSISANPSVVLGVGVAMVGASTFSSSPTVTLRSTSDLSANSEIAANSAVDKKSQASLASSAAITAIARGTFSSTVDMSESATLLGTTTIISQARCDLMASASIQPIAVKSAVGGVALGASSNISLSGKVIRRSSSVLSSESQVTSTARETARSRLDAGAVSEMMVFPTLFAGGRSILVSDSFLGVVSINHLAARATLTSHPRLLAGGVGEVSAIALLAGNGSRYMVRRVTKVATEDVSQYKRIPTVGTIKRRPCS